MLLIGERYRRKLETSLNYLHIPVLWLPDNPDVDERLAGHADLMVYANGQQIAAAPAVYDFLVRNLADIDASYSLYKAAPQDKLYPRDCGLCVRSVGAYDICNPQTADAAVRTILHGTAIHTRQGYTACSVCAVSERAIITSDSSIASAAEGLLDVLLIRPGFIRLDGFSYGFIGGAAFAPDEHRLAFTGHLREHPDKEEIANFLAKYNVEPVLLTDEPLFDIGGAISLP